MEDSKTVPDKVLDNENGDRSQNNKTSTIAKDKNKVFSKGLNLILKYLIATIIF
ncbi:hypothetical protein ACGO3R_11865 [Lactococcus lactis]